MTSGSAATATSVGADRRSDAFVLDSVPENYARFLAQAIFEPWARVLVESIGVTRGETVLDVATGTGVVARLAARSAGPAGRVLASDISAAMLAVGEAQAVDPDSAPIEWVEAPATNLGVPEGEFGVVLCQQGLPFFIDRISAAREMRRVLRTGGVVGLAVWAAGYPLFPFHEFTEVLNAHDVPAPFAGAYDGSSYVMSEAEVNELLTDAGFSEIDVQTVDLQVSWPDRDAVASGILGTPFGPLIQALPEEPRRALMTDLATRFGAPSDRPVGRVTTSIIARAVA